MATTIEIAGTAIDYDDFEITIPISTGGVAPTAVIQTNSSEAISASDTVEIIIGGTTRFSGEAVSGGTANRIGSVRVKAEHTAVELFEEDVSFTETGPPTVDDVLRGALDASDSGSAFSLSSTGTNVTLSDDYEAENRSVKRVFRDMTDRAGLVWWVDPVNDTINVEPAGDRGQWLDINTQTDKIPLTRWDPGNRKTAINDVTVIGTGGAKVEGTATDATSITDYGRREQTYNVDYIKSQSEADAMASALLVPDPLAEGKLLAGSNAGTVEAAQVNKTVAVTDDAKGVDESGLVIEQQTIQQGRAELQIGQGNTVSIANLNRDAKSQQDNTRPGSVYNTDRIADGAIESTKLVDASVIEAKLADLSVATAKLQDSAVINGKLSDLSVSETKIQDDSIATPKLQASAVTANEIAADTITAAEIAAGTITALEIAADTITASEIAADTITALEIAADTITANEIDVLDLNAGELTVTGTTDGNDDATIKFEIQNNVDIFGTDVITIRASGTAEAWLGTTSEPWDHGIIRQVEPDSDNIGNIGSSTNAYADVYAHNYVTASPDEIDSVNLNKLTDTDWYDNPPKPVRDRASDIGETDAEIPDGMDHTPVELGTMANWLLETCKSQQETIDRQADRIDDLEARLEVLEQSIQ